MARASTHALVLSRSVHSGLGSRIVAPPNTGDTAETSINSDLIPHPSTSSSQLASPYCIPTSPMTPLSLSPSTSLLSSSMSCEEMHNKIATLTMHLQEKEQELTVAMRWKDKAESKLEDLKDHLQDILDTV
ncbi:hypothetical protein BS47DRAFT_1359104 [Hydnum rufescens UP504]|uniref:Uncharacterized protein n=1 Tax=Hydnum rufescens UP504 TaxID=1448309 RepID=A0A9P6B881_9AGAM|nr:hypothetical protein BS47DRAFT_1359104 [Hydnum rufescens UP504]